MYARAVRLTDVDADHMASIEVCAITAALLSRG